MNRAPAFQFYPKDWLDFRVQRMSLAAQGAYLKILCYMWADSKDQCSLEDNDELISRALGTSQETWMRFKTEIQHESDPIFKKENGLLISERLREEALKQKKYRKLQAKKGKSSSLQRLNRGSTAVQPVHQPGANSPSSSSSPSSSTKDKSTTSFQGSREIQSNLSKHKLSSRLDPIPYEEIIGFLNEKTGKNFKANAEESQKLIRARWKTGFRVVDFRKVIENMTVRWGKDPERSQYLRPITLFGTKFESYLNAEPTLSDRGLVSPATERNMAVFENWLSRKEAEEGRGDDQTGFS
jgi:uncharacterized phage protein (TIGR02220 family)